MVDGHTVDGMTPRPTGGGWLGADLENDAERWQVHLSATIVDDLLRAGAMLVAGNGRIDPFQQPPAVSDETRSMVATLYRRLADDPGLVLLTGFPVREEPNIVQAAYWCLGLLLGRPTRQTVSDDLLIRIENVGRNTSVPGGQKYRLPVALPFHVDVSTDVIGLLCMRPSESGGQSLVASFRTVHDIVLADYPDLLPVLYRPFPFRIPPLKYPDSVEASRWCEIPVFSRTRDQFAGFYQRDFIHQSQSLDGAPQLTEEQVAALDAVDEVLSRPEVALRLELHTGYVQLINNLCVTHSRTEYVGATSERQGRLLLRIWLAFGGSPALPEWFGPLFGATAGGTYRGGSWRTEDITERFGTPLRL